MSTYHPPQWAEARRASVEHDATSDSEEVIVETPNHGKRRVTAVLAAVFLAALVACLYVFPESEGEPTIGISRPQELISFSAKLEMAKKQVEEALNEAAKKEDHHELRVLDPDLKTILRVKHALKMKTANKVTCAFNAVEAFWSAMGLGDDINGMVRVCPDPRPPRSEVACQVDAGILIFWVGNLASKLASAVSNCEDTISVGGGWLGGVYGNKQGPLCAQGIGQLVGALGQLAGASSLAASACENATLYHDGDDDQNGFWSGPVSTFGDQTQDRYGYFLGRQLLIGEGYVGNDIQCAVDIGMVATNIANMGLAINSAVQSGNCQHVGLGQGRSALCAVDIGNAVTFFAQIVSFIQFSILNCEDLMNVSALCGASIAGIGAAAAGIAPAGAAIDRGCNPPIIPPVPPTSTTTTSSLTSTTTMTTSSTTFTTSSTSSTSSSTSTSQTMTTSSTSTSSTSSSTSTSQTMTTSSSSSTTTTSTTTTTSSSVTSSSSSTTTSSTTSTTSSTTETTTTFTQAEFDCLSLGFVPLQMINRDRDTCTGSDIKRLDINTGTYTVLCSFDNECFNACGLSPKTNFIYCMQRGSSQLMRLDCPAGGTGTACFLGKTKGSFSANFDPLSGDFVQTNQQELDFVANVDDLVCSGTPVNTDIITSTQPLNTNNGNPTLADLMVTNLTALGPGQWLVSCTDDSRVYIQSFDDPNTNFFLTLLGTDVNTITGSSGAQWQWNNDLYCAYNPNGVGVWELGLNTIDIIAGTIEVKRVSNSEATNSNDGLNCLGGTSPFGVGF